MADPLSIAAGIVGVVTAAAQISSLLINFTKNCQDAPRQARSVLTEVSETSSVLSSLQSFLLGKEAVSRSRTSLIPVNQVVVIVTGCVSTFSELQELLDGLKSDSVGILDRLRWVRMESAISSIIQRLQTHKASLSLILTILNNHTMEDVKNSTDRLASSVNELYQEILSKLRTLEMRQLQTLPRAPSLLSLNAIDMSPPEQLDPASRQIPDNDNIPKSHFNFTFDADLRASPAYRRLSRRFSEFSLSTRHAHTTRWSILSDLSMANVSNVSVISLAITAGEVYNASQYVDPNIQYSEIIDDQILRSNEVGSQPRARLIKPIYPKKPKDSEIAKKDNDSPLVPGTFGDCPVPYDPQMTRYSRLLWVDLQKMAIAALVIDIEPAGEVSHSKTSKVSVGMLMDLSAIFYLATRSNSAEGDSFIDRIHQIESSIKYQGSGNSTITIVGRLASIEDEEHQYFAQRSLQTAKKIKHKRDFKSWTETWGPATVHISVFCSLVAPSNSLPSSRRAFIGMYDQSRHDDIQESGIIQDPLTFSSGQGISNQDLATYLLRRMLDEDKVWSYRRGNQ